MTLLLDTHVFLWFVAADPRLPPAYRDAIRNPSHDVYLSVASIWEAAIKVAVGKLILPSPPSAFLSAQRSAHGIQSLPIEESTLDQLDELPLLHRDPFDRILVAQALDRKLTLLTVDDAVKAYAVSVLSP